MSLSLWAISWFAPLYVYLRPLYYFLRPMIKWFLKKVTGKCELLRITLQYPLGAERTLCVGMLGQIKKKCVLGNRSEILGKVGAHIFSIFFSGKKYNCMHFERHFNFQNVKNEFFPRKPEKKSRFQQ